MPCDNVVIGWRNFALAGTVLSASSQVLTMPAANLLTPRLGAVWRSSTAGAQYAVVDLLAERQIDLAALVNSNLTAAGYWRVRGSLLDAGATSALTIDTGHVGGIDPARGLTLTGCKGRARYVRIDIQDATRPYLQAGHVYIGNGWQPRRNFAFDWRSGYVDVSTRILTEGGQIYVDERPARRREVIRLAYIDDDEVEHARDLVREVRAGTDVLMDLRPGRHDSATWAVFGLLDELPALQPSGRDLWTMSLSVTERI